MEEPLEFQVFAKEGCELCAKAQEILRRAGVEPVVRYVDGPNATVDNLADFAWYDWTDKPPLVIVKRGEEILARWDGRTVTAGLTPVVRQLLGQHDAAGSSPSAA